MRQLNPIRRPRFMTTAIEAACVLAVASALAGCVVAPGPRYAPGPDYVVTVRPPPPRYEVVPAPGDPLLVWDPGRWRWDGRAYVWVPGRYIRRPYRESFWVPGRWEPRAGSWVWVEGHWGRR